MAFLGFRKKEEKEKKTPQAKKPEKKEKVISVVKDKKETKKKKVAKTVKTVKPAKVGTTFNPGKVILKPRITEKSNILAEDRNAYTFLVSPRASKTEIKKAIQSIYKVTPVKINTTNIPSKKVMSRGIKGIKSGGRKAIVYLKEGDKIEFV